MKVKKTLSALVACLICGLSAPGMAQSNPAAPNSTGGRLSGAVTLGGSAKAAHNVRVTIIQLRRSLETDENGRYEFRDVPPGSYDVSAHLEVRLVYTIRFY